MRALANPFYYLDNFRHALAWVKERYADLLTDGERDFIDTFQALPTAPQALLVRMVMRKGTLFRSSKLNYPEIGCPREAVRRLTALGWVDDDPLLTPDDLFGLLTKSELLILFPSLPRKTGTRKSELLDSLRAGAGEARRFREWHPAATGPAAESVYALRIADLCDRLRLIYFGNLHQNWSEFVVAELGILAYEKVAFSVASRGFQARQDIDDYLHLYRCGERFELGEPLADILSDIRAVSSGNSWLAGRQAKLLFRAGQYLERDGDLTQALDVYAACPHPGSRMRAVRVLEKMERFEEAHALALRAEEAPEDDAERQQLQRILPRLRRRLGLPKMQAPRAFPIPRIDLVLDRPITPSDVEFVVRDHLLQPEAPVFYVENALINSLFGLLCWRAIFTPLPGAFFHLFHSGPADLHSPDFRRRRQREFAECLAQLDSGEYKRTIRQCFQEKAGIQSPFVSWDMLDRELLELALACMPAAHLRKWFERILADIKSNCSGFPDLIQFWPGQSRYRMIEVKGPGDRLQDNQIRYLDFCLANDMPVVVCHVQWREAAA